MTSTRLTAFERDFGEGLQADAIRTEFVKGELMQFW